MRITQGAFSYLPDLTDRQIFSQIQWAVKNGWSVSVEYTQDPHPLNCYWNMWGLPLFDIKDPNLILAEVNRAIYDNPDNYVKVCCFDNSRGVESCALSFIVSRPWEENGFELIRQEGKGRNIVYTLKHIPASEDSL
jgi:ribulose-bisphosphate carboxylase small chain